MKLFLQPSAEEWQLFGTIFLAISLFILTAELIRKYFHGSPEITRKVVHILTGVLIFFAPQLFISGIPALLLAISFIAINYGAIRFGLLRGMHGTNRTSYGTVYYPMSFLVLVVLFWNSYPFLLSISILTLALGDAAAAIVGENLNHPHNYYLTSDKKSIEGSTAMFITTLAMVFTSLRYFEIPLGVNELLMLSGATAIFVTAWEAISSKGFDNLTVPLSAAFMLHYLVVPMQHHLPSQLYSGLFLGILIAGVSLYFQFLSKSGSVAVMILATIIFGIGGWLWTIPILVFFISSSILSRYGKMKKKKFELIFEKSDRRDEGQVAANGGAAGLLALLWYISPENSQTYFMYVASIASAAADTWATEIGTLFGMSPRSILTLKKVEPGTSGGISFWGTIGGIAGASLIALSAWIMNGEQVTNSIFLKIIFAGFAGSIIDSIVGAAVQAQYQTEDGQITEKVLFSGKPTRLIRGFRLIDNDIVNWICVLSGATVMGALLLM